MTYFWGVMRSIILITALFYFSSINAFAQSSEAKNQFSGSLFRATKIQLYRDLKAEAAKWCFKKAGINGVGLTCSELACGFITCTLSCICNYWPRKIAKMEIPAFIDPLNGYEN